MNKIYTGRFAWLTSILTAYTILAIFAVLVGPGASKEVVDISRLVVYAIVFGTYAATGSYIILEGKTEPKWHGLLGISALGGAVFLQGAVIYFRRILDRPDWLTTPWIDLFLAFNITLAGLLFLSGPHLADTDMPRRSFRWIIICVGVLCSFLGILVGRYLAPGV